MQSSTSMMSDASSPDPQTMGASSPDGGGGRRERDERKMRRSSADDDRARSDLMHRLSETGEKDRDAIRSRGLQKVTVDELVADVLPKGRAAVPDGIKSELLRDVRDFARRENRDRSNLE